MPKLYKTAQGRTVDIGALMTQNERTRAVGNMNVNARGDVIDNQNQVVMPRSRQINRNLNAGINKHIDAKAAVTGAGSNSKKTTIQPDVMPTEPVIADTNGATGLAGALVRANQNKESK